MDTSPREVLNDRMTIRKTSKQVAKDTVILAEGADANNQICYLVRGTAVVEVKGNVVGTVKAGEWFGELAAILHSTRTASVRAVTPCEVLFFEGIKDTGLYEAMSSDKKMIQKLIEQLCFRLVETSQRHSKDTGELAEQSMRWRQAISATLFALQQLSTKYKSKVMEEVRSQLAAMSGIAVGQASDCDPKHFTTSKDVIFGK